MLYLIYSIFSVGNLSSVVPRPLTSLPHCTAAQPQYNVTLYGGLAAGTFTNIGKLNPEMCARLCCHDTSCDVAFSVDGMCYNVQCNNSKLCLTKPVWHSRHNIAVTHVKRVAEKVRDRRKPIRRYHRWKNYDKSPTARVESSLSPETANADSYKPKHFGKAVKSEVMLTQVKSGSSLRQQNNGSSAETIGAAATVARDAKNNRTTMTFNKTTEVSRHLGSLNRKTAKYDSNEEDVVGSSLRTVGYSGKPFKLTREHSQSHKNNPSGLSNVSDVQTSLAVDNSMGAPSFLLSSAGLDRRPSQSREQDPASLTAVNVSDEATNLEVYDNKTGKGSSGCKPRRIQQNVTLRSGLRSGDFTDYGSVKDMSTCVDYCCKVRTCDVALMLGPKCYTLHCKNPSLCKIMPAHPSKLNPQLAFVSREDSVIVSTTAGSTLDLKAKSSGRKHTAKAARITNKKSTRANRSSRQSKKSGTQSCPHGAVLNDVTLSGGRSAGRFKLRAISRDIHKCIKMCCESPSCDVAWVLGQSCFSVECHGRDQCKPVKTSKARLRSQLSIITRKRGQGANQSKWSFEKSTIIRK